MLSRQSRFSLLLVDDEPMVLSSLKRLFFDHEYDIHTSPGGTEALELMRTTAVDAALIDLKMPGMDGLTLLRKIRSRHPSVMCLMLTGHGGVREAVEAIKLGALDFLEKPYHSDELCSRVAQLHRVWMWKALGHKLEAERELRDGDDPMVGASQAMVGLKQLIARAAPSDANILILGETGTGKELVARAIHSNSPRASSPFVALDCSTLNETVVESELFGHVKGAFTGAHASSSGLIASADKGTLFLDEVGELPPTLQPKLLRVLQQREVRPVGGTKSRLVDVRIVAATNRDLEQEVAGGRFRRDLFYRLGVVAMHVPPLRERREDIAPLIQYFLGRYGSRTAPEKSVSPQALELLETYAWPGNVRELENVIQRALALSLDDTITPEDLPGGIRALASKAVESPALPSPASMIEVEKNAIDNALRMSGNNRRKAAEVLGIGEATLYRKIKKYHKRSETGA